MNDYRKIKIVYNTLFLLAGWGVFEEQWSGGNLDLGAPTSSRSG